MVVWAKNKSEYQVPKVPDVYKNESSPKEVTETQNFYENQYLEVEKPITYIQFKLKY